MHQGWCTNRRIINTCCSPDFETTTVLCRPFYRLRDITAVLVTAIYISPDVNVSFENWWSGCLFCRQNKHEEQTCLTSRRIQSFLLEGERTYPAPLTARPSSNHFELQEHQVRGVLKAEKPNKVAEPDGKLSKLLRACTDLLGVLKQATLPACLKSAALIRVHKKTISSLIDDRPVALTSVVMNCCEKLVL